MRERILMATISDYDEKIEKKKDEIVRLEARRKALLRKERERERKWKTAFQNTIGEIVVQAVGCGWQELDLELFQAWLEEASRRLSFRSPRRRMRRSAAMPSAENRLSTGRRAWETGRQICNRFRKGKTDAT
ncbi:hypothetical protein ACTNEN_12620 [Oribacterium sp. HCP28S3_H8]|uniref:hypothetical protein n=1 Tax=Oribacterium sp. HCP28S3_H8 TaxID=3438945 RepID=UPI003F8918CB